MEIMNLYNMCLNYIKIQNHLLRFNECLDENHEIWIEEKREVICEGSSEINKIITQFKYHGDYLNIIMESLKNTINFEPSLEMSEEITEQYALALEDLLTNPSTQDFLNGKINQFKTEYGTIKVFFCEKCRINKKDIDFNEEMLKKQKKVCSDCIRIIELKKEKNTVERKFRKLKYKLEEINEEIEEIDDKTGSGICKSPDCGILFRFKSFRPLKCPKCEKKGTLNHYPYHAHCSNCNLEFDTWDYDKSVECPRCESGFPFIDFPSGQFM